MSDAAPDRPLDRDTASRWVGNRFRILLAPGSPESQTLDAELIEVSSAGPALNEELARNGRPFSMVFRGPGEPVLSQSIYALEHPELGRLDLFLVPVGRDEDGVQYEAVFN